MTTLEPEQKDILEKLNEVALEANWGTVNRADGIPKVVAVIQEAVEEIKQLRELPKDILQETWKQIWSGEMRADEIVIELAEKYGITLD